MKTETLTERTKGEWYVSDKLQKDKNMCPIPYYEICNKSDMTWIAHVAAGNLKDNGEAEANAAFICKAVNNYDSLLNALKKIVELEYESGRSRPYIDAVITITKEAIKKAEQ